MYDTKKFFNDRAAVWDKLAETQDPEKLCIMLILSDIRPDSLILDVGCGTGALEPYLLAYSPKKVIAVDFAPNMIEAAKAKLEHPAIEFRCADYFELADIQADYAFFVSSFPHFPNPKEALEKAASLLRPGGRLTISNIQGKYCGDSADILNPMLPAQGLINLLQPYFRIDVIIDNRAMFLISGVRLHEKRR
jgi:demethylmenaquinone methyltransferase/2-methoxy-6-polyprenyl-1,4-benzoquinol methylase